MDLSLIINIDFTISNTITVPGGIFEHVPPSADWNHSFPSLYLGMGVDQEISPQVIRFPDPFSAEREKCNPIPAQRVNPINPNSRKCSYIFSILFGTYLVIPRNFYCKYHT